MAFFLSKEERQKKLEAKELERQREAELREQRIQEVTEQRRKAENAKDKYCDWYSMQIERFVEELRSKGFIATWGFEVEPAINIQQGTGGKQYANKFVFDVPPLEGLAFDINSKQMLYFKCPTGFHDTFENPNEELKFDYVLIPFTSIFSAQVEVNSQTTVSTITSKQNVVGRSIIGGLIAGDTGAIIAGTTGKNVSVSKTDSVLEKIVFYVQTIHPEYPIISFEFKKPWNATGANDSNKSIGDTMCSTFSDEKKRVSFHKNDQIRQCDTSVDYFYRRHYIKSNNTVDSHTFYSECISKSDLEVILQRINKYVMKIESIIQQCNLEMQSTNITPNVDIISEIKKLAELKEQGIITDEEFIKLKAKFL